MNKKSILIIVFVFFLLSGFLINSPTVAQSSSTIQLRFSNWLPPTSVIVKDGITPWMKTIEERTHGRVKFTYFGASTLGKMDEHYNIALKGVADIAWIAPALSPGVFPLTQFIFLPMIFPSGEVAAATYWEMVEKYLKDNELSDVKPLWCAFLHPTQLHMKTKFVKTVEDFKGVKLIAGTPADSEMIKVLGAAPVLLGENDAYTALERGMVDGRFNLYESMVIFRNMEVTKYRTNNINFYVLGSIAVMNKKTWNKLPEDIKKIINDCSGIDYSRKVSHIADEAEKKAIEIVLDYDKKVGNPPPFDFREDDKMKMKEKVMVVHEAWAAEAEKNGMPGKELLQDIYNWTEKYSASQNR